MKKLLYTLAFVLTLSAALTSCTEEEVKPTYESTPTSGGGAQEDLKR